MRRGLLLGGLAGVLNGGLALLLTWWFGRRPTEFGWFSYSPMPRRYADYVSSDAVTPAWEIITVTVAVFLVLNIALAAVIIRSRRRAGRRAA